ncbi:hypothetical protein NWP21_09455 [Anabaenopsis sp. FSS-46]|uniref:hypothetical protein n=1 Tax=Anabaenopsis sp. FSS-46 TaxID=2971766 RepID=UPI002475A83C|nr:hypothetical protein [Anabaenopsis sp. FSS-46]MDH6099066.1 hypothetical protein [Anabaenopsis sp. FSS-46]
MSAILSTPRIFGLVLIGLMITSCRGYTSSYIQPSTPTVNRQQSTPTVNRQPSTVNSQWLEQQRADSERENAEYRRVSGCMDNCLASTDPNCMSRCS